MSVCLRCANVGRDVGTNILVFRGAPFTPLPLPLIGAVLQLGLQRRADDRGVVNDLPTARQGSPETDLAQLLDPCLVVGTAGEPAGDRRGDAQVLRLDAVEVTDGLRVCARRGIGQANVGAFVPELDAELLPRHDADSNRSGTAGASVCWSGALVVADSAAKP